MAAALRELCLKNQQREAMDDDVSQSLEALEPSEASLHKVEHLLKTEHAQVRRTAGEWRVRRGACGRGVCGGGACSGGACGGGACGACRRGAC